MNGKMRNLNCMQKFFKALWLILQKPWLLNKIINDNNQWKKYVARKYKLEKGFPVGDIIDITGHFDETIKPYAFLEGGSLITDIALLRVLAKNIKSCKYFEIGTWRGESVANVAEVAGSCCTLNLPYTEIKDAGYSDEYACQYGVLSKKIDNIIHLKGNSLNFDFAGLNEKFDLIFIDGDHHYEMVRNDSQKVFRHLVHDDSVVVWHDYAFNPETIRYEVMAGILDGTSPQVHNNLYHVSNTLCAIYTRKPLKSRPFESPARLNKIFDVNIKSSVYPDNS